MKASPAIEKLLLVRPRKFIESLMFWKMYSLQKVLKTVQSAERYLTSTTYQFSVSAATILSDKPALHPD